MQKAQIDPLDPRNNIDLLLEQERKWMDSLKIACVTPQNKEPVFATCVAWLIGQGYVSLPDFSAKLPDFSAKLPDFPAKLLTFARIF